MTRNSAINQARYRARKKMNDPAYLTKERERVAKYYVPTSELSRKAVEKRRNNGRESMRRQRDRKRQGIESASTDPKRPKIDDRVLRYLKRQHSTGTGDIRVEVLQSEASSSALAQTNEHVARDTFPVGSRLNIKFPFHGKSRSRKRISRVVANVKRQNKSLQKQLQGMQRRVWQLKKKNTRAANQYPSTTRHALSPIEKYNASTPVKVADAMLRDVGVSPRKVKRVRKSLILHNSLVKHLKSVGKIACKAAIKSVGQTRSARLLAELLTVNRDVRKLKAKRETNRKISAAIHSRSIGLFYKQEQNSTCLPGKRDSVKVAGERFQKYILNDNISALHQKYNFENPDRMVSLSLFQRCRPKHVLPVSYASRKVCLCQRHQNFALRLRVLRSQGVIQSPDQFIKTETKESAAAKICALPSDTVTYHIWKQVERPYKESFIKKTTLLEESISKTKFQEDFLNSMNAFRLHVSRVHAQYENLALLKESLLQDECTVQVDFAENYVCHFFEEVSSAYYSKEQVTIHPAVIHYRSNGEVYHKSLVVVSDETAHNAATVFAFIKVIVAWISENMPLIRQIHYLSDSPTSQYRNCSIFNIVSLHKTMFNISASWHYFESGHGKGPCDGVGGAVKRAADSAVKKGMLITTAQEFYEWGISQTTSAVTYLLVNKVQVHEASIKLTSLGAVTVQGTMTTHAVMPVKDYIYIRETSCFQPCCWSLGTFHPTCSGWLKRQTRSDLGVLLEGAEYEVAVAQRTSSAVIKRANSVVKQATAPANKRKKATPKWFCPLCKWAYGDKDDPLLSDDWISCGKCKEWFHITCAENNGRLDDGDDIFSCPICLTK